MWGEADGRVDRAWGEGMREWGENEGRSLVKLNKVVMSDCVYIFYVCNLIFVI